MLPERRPRAHASRRRRAATRAGSPQALADGELTALYLLHADPLRDAARPRGSGSAALRRARRPSSPTRRSSPRASREHADVVFPAEAYAEKEGTVTHPDGRLQRLRPAIARARRRSAPSWQVLAELAAARSGSTSACSPARDGLAQLFEAVPVLRRPDARGDRRPRRALAGARRGRGAAPGERAPFEPRGAAAPRQPNGALRLGTFRSIWAAPEVDARRRCSSCARASSSSSRRPTPSASASTHGDRVDGRRRRRRVAATVALRARRARGHASSSPRHAARTAPTPLLDGGRGSCEVRARR